MNPCDACPEPGKCCRSFQLNIDFPEGTDRAAVLERVRGEGLPFEPSRPSNYAEEEGVERWIFSCPRLLPSGRCGDYGDRPDPCRTYEPGSNGLCVLHVAEPEPAPEPELAQAPALH